MLDACFWRIVAGFWMMNNGYLILVSAYWLDVITKVQTLTGIKQTASSNG